MKQSFWKKLKSTITALAIVFSLSYVPVATANDWFDSYGKIDWETEQAHLYNFAIFLKEKPEMVGYIAYNWTDLDECNEMKRRAKRASDYLMRS